MVMKEVAISEFKAKCLAILEQVHKTKKPILVTRFGKPVAEVVPPSVATAPRDWMGSMKDTIQILGDIVSPANEESDWEVLKD
jgi:prevent-host-death family protein